MRVLLLLLVLIARPLRGADPYAPLGAMLPGRAHLFLSALAAPEAGADFDAQARVALGRLDARLQAAGLRREALVYVHAYVLGSADQTAWRERLHDYLPQAPAHVRDTILPALPLSGAKLLLECLAAFPESTDPTCGEPGPNSGVRTLVDAAAREAAGAVVAAAAHLHTVNDRTAFGASTAAQAAAIFGQLRITLADEKLTLTDVVQIRATLAPDEGTYDLPGWNKAFAHFFSDTVPAGRPAVTIITGKARQDDHRVAVDFVVAARNLPAAHTP
jgi:enamine deaminase RidA (YjgF/YER057c/UK114 family)